MQPGMQLIRVTGMDGAEAYQMPPNSVVPLFDADNDIVYIESTDGAGFPTIRAFAFQPIENPTPQTQRYATREEFNDTLAKLMEADPQFAAFVNQNKGKSPEQIARENGIDFNMAQKMFK